MFPAGFGRALTAGDRNQHMTIEAATQIRTPSGAKTDDWDNPETIAERWALVLNKASREVYRARQFNAETEVVMVIEGYAAITEKMRARHEDGRVYDILGVHSDDGRAPINAPWLYLFCKEGASKGS